MTLEDALNTRHEAQRQFERALKQKIESIQFAYSKGQLSSKQLEFIQRDESFCKASETFANKLIGQINFLVNENKQQLLMMSDMARESERLREEWINMCLELNALKLEKQREKGELRFDFVNGKR